MSYRMVTHLGVLGPCLAYLDRGVDDAWLFGATGYAFMINVPKGVGVGVVAVDVIVALPVHIPASAFALGFPAPHPLTDPVGIDPLEAGGEGGKSPV